MFTGEASVNENQMKCNWLAFLENVLDNVGVTFLCFNTAEANLSNCDKGSILN